jgi:ATP-binding cassette subfamily B protein
LIRERGRHEDLVQAGGLYSELFARQDLTTSN